MKVVLAGGSGALGRRLAGDLVAGGHEVVVLTRRVRDGAPARQVRWDGVTLGDWVAELEGASVVNLAGELVDRPPTPANVGLLTQSRVAPTRALVEASRRIGTVGSWVQASTLAIHGDAAETVVDDDAPPADGPPQWRAWPGRGRRRSRGPGPPRGSPCCGRAWSSTRAHRPSTGCCCSPGGDSAGGWGAAASG